MQAPLNKVQDRLQGQMAKLKNSLHPNREARTVTAGGVAMCSTDLAGHGKPHLRAEAKLRVDGSG